MKNHRYCGFAAQASEAVGGASQNDPANRLRSLAYEEEGYWEVLAEILRKSRVAGSKIHDARIAALCVQHAVTELWTADRDFSRFADLKTRNPLA